MNKKWMAILVAVVALVCVACTAQPQEITQMDAQSNAEAQDGAAAEPTADMTAITTNNGLETDDFDVYENGEAVVLHQDFPSVADLGIGQPATEQESGGEDVTTLKIYSFEQDDGYTTKRGIKLGDSTQAVADAYKGVPAMFAGVATGGMPLDEYIASEEATGTINFTYVLLSDEGSMYSMAIVIEDDVVISIAISVDV